MELIEKITLDMLNKNSVSVLKQTFIVLNDVEQQVGDNIRNVYMNSPIDRENIKKVLNKDYYDAVIAVWGDAPTINDPVIE